MFDNIRKAFAVRFEPDGDGYLFRPKLTAPAVRVTAVERDRFIADYMKSFWIYLWTTAVAGPLLMIGVLTFLIFRDIDPPTPLMMAMVAVVLVPTYLGSRWIYRAPDRALADRATSAPGYSDDEAKKITMRRLTWRNIGVSIFILVALVVKMVLDASGKGRNLLEGDNRYWLILPAVLAVFIVVQVVRKWRSELH